MPIRSIIVLALFVITADAVSGDPPIVRPPHPAAPDADRFITDREGRTLDLPAEDETFTFVVFGDRTGGPADGVKILAEAVADTNLYEPDLVMTVGDLIQGYGTEGPWMDEMREFRGIMDGLLCPWFPVAGNHDVYWRGPDRPANEHEANYEMHFGPLWYAFDHKDRRFIVLYTDEADPKTGERNFSKPASQRMSPEQLAWLKTTLASAKDKKDVFVFLHHPRWIGGGYGDDWERIDYWENLPVHPDISDELSGEPVESQQCLLIHFAAAWLWATEGAVASVAAVLALASVWRAEQFDAAREADAVTSQWEAPVRAMEAEVL